MNYYCKNKDNISKLPSIKSDTHHILPSVKWLNSAFDALSNRKTALCNTYTSELLPVYCSNQYFPLYSAPIHNQHIIQKQMPALLTPVQTTFLSMYISVIACTPLITKKRAVRWTLLSESYIFSSPGTIHNTTLSYIMLLFSFYSDFVYNEKIWEELPMNTQKPLKVKVSITLDEDVIHQIRALAETDDRNFSQYINLVLKKHLNDTQKKEDGKK